MKTLEDEQSTITDDRSKMSFPKEIIEDILSRLPVKSILRFKSVSKPWLSLISAPSFHNLHSAVGSRTTALFFSAFDSSTGTRYFFSGANDGGSVANLMKLDNIVSNFAHKFAEHLNGLVCFTSRASRRFGRIYAFIFNPSTHKFLKLPDPPVSLPNYTTAEEKDTCYLFGFDELTNEHKVLYIDVELIKPTTIEIMIFSLSNYSWRKIKCGSSCWCECSALVVWHQK
ncbi:putative F-box domain, galactose oxidase/kelch, beta-propeller, F-box associated interaction [Helianthus annuus]|uniref:F-box domain, galactose oxidase/kelch, beta-propeller, F-box associated interaction n=2 Tax=Helianthus annuus TaxID=4232 RepID=A0A251T3I1_HELAN|nr:putative F-box domain, galactose oxidase/kelch, beta-propeller, F-box associated interaction [Helianthus annuus]KAJ0506009.1 putative F-box domain, galactose oxidase/kelch, beta-propeller, F-box associated interaction [Helianthus annuus]KAJ0675678.1 putative F-box domain, galactose oxidase/kelch, beta-propeller, F-box associated interaction [Helianthus annuus]KAJ0678954.1 putative F-box domain, galactose oxidase/kelch, beta-propeller, F-box associated interaction [Helianthus annuus]KAJ086735